MITRAISFAKEKHKGQKRDGGEDYIEHLLEVMLILKTITEDEEIISAGILHDVIEDTNTTYDELKNEFGHRVADLVMEVTHEGMKDRKGFYFPRLHSRDGIMIKFADRLSNLNAIDSWHVERQNAYLRKSKFWKSDADE